MISTLRNSSVLFHTLGRKEVILKFLSLTAILSSGSLSIAFTLASVLIFDLLIASSSIMPFRFIYDIAFVMVIFVPIYISVLLLRNEKISSNCTAFSFPRISFFIPILLNLKAALSAACLDVPSVGHLSSDMLVQSVSSLLPLLEFLMLATVNGILLWAAISKKKSISVYEIPTYVLCVIAIETSLALYSFHLGGVGGIRLCLSLFHMGMCGVFAWSLRKFRMEEVRVKASLSDMLLMSLSAGIFLMVYFRFGVYLLFGDSSVVTASVLGIIYRGGLNPYYEATDYYSPIGGFVSTVFTYSCGLDNILLASILPFFVGHLLLPFVTYHFLKSVVTDDSRIAIIGAVMSLLMDGLAVVLLPAYGSNLTPSVIQQTISVATMSLRASTLTWIWHKPFNVLGMATAMAVCNIPERSKAGLLLESALFFLSFVNLRQPFHAILLLTFMYGIKRVCLGELGTLLLGTVVFLGPVVTTISYQSAKATLYKLHEVDLITEDAATQTIAFFRSFAEHPLILAAPLVLTSLAGILFLARLNSRNPKPASVPFTSEFQQRSKEMPQKKLLMRTVIGGKTLRLRISLRNVYLLNFFAMSVAIMVFVVSHAYGHLPPMLGSFGGIDVIDALSYIALRYHILVVLVIIGLLRIKYDLRTLATIGTLITLAYLGLLGGELARAKLHAPTIFVVIALPALNLFVKNRRKIEMVIVLTFVLLGVFSASLYSATAKTSEADPRIVDLPHVLRILLNRDPEEKVFTPSYYPYYVNRTLQMANLQGPDSDPASNVYFVDRVFTSVFETWRLDQLLESNYYRVLYNGEGFTLLERCSADD